MAGVFVNTVFGVIKLSILLGVADSAGGTVAGYDADSLSTYTWMSQGMIAVVLIFGWTELRRPGAHRRHRRRPGAAGRPAAGLAGRRPGPGGVGPGVPRGGADRLRGSLLRLRAPRQPVDARAAAGLADPRRGRVVRLPVHAQPGGVLDHRDPRPGHLLRAAVRDAGRAPDPGAAVPGVAADRRPRHTLPGHDPVADQPGHRPGPGWAAVGLVAAQLGWAVGAARLSAASSSPGRPGSWWYRVAEHSTAASRRADGGRAPTGRSSGRGSRHRRPTAPRSRSTSPPRCSWSSSSSSRST